MNRMFAALAVAAALLSTSTAQAESPRDLFADGFASWVRFLPDAGANPDDTWSLQDGVLACTGKPNGYVRTTEVFSNYVVHIEWRWTGEPGNSGLLLHVGGDDMVWPKAIESQLQNGNAGDFYMMGGAVCNEPREGRRIRKQHDSNEKAPGEWNVMEATCQGDTITIRVNGIEQNRATGCSITSGHVALQSEGRPIAFRHVTITPIEP